MVVARFAFPNRLSVSNAPLPARAILRQVGGSQIWMEFPFGPQDVEYSDDTLSYTEIPRPGRTPLLAPNGKKLRRVRVTALLANPGDGGQTTVERWVLALKTMAREDVDVEFQYGRAAVPFRLRIEELIVTARRRRRTGEMIQAEVDILLVESAQLNQGVIPMKPLPFTPEIRAKTSPPKQSKRSSKEPGGGGKSGDADFQGGDPPAAKQTWTATGWTRN